MTSADQFMGFLELRSQNTSFEGETIKLAVDVVINDKTVAEMQATAPAHVNLQMNSKYYFCGTFDGQNHTVSGAYMEPAASLRGLFGGLGDNACIKNLTLKDSYFKGTNSSGAGGTAFIAGRAGGDGIVIENVHIKGCVFKTSAAIMDGASTILGRVDGGKRVLIKNCSVDANTLIDVSNNQSTVVSGLVAIVQSDANLTVENTTVAPTLKAADVLSEFVAKNSGTVNIDQNSKFNGKVISVYTGSPKTDWYTGNKNEYILTSADQFMGFLQLRSKNTSFEGETVKLAVDVVINDKTVAEMQAAVPAYVNLQMTSNYYFCGTFDGQNHTVSGVYMEPTSSLRGLFGGLGDNACLQNFTLKNSYFKGTNTSSAGGTGMLAGRAGGVGIVIDNVHVQGCAFTSTGAIMDGVSAILGRVDSKKDVLIKNCSVDAQTVIDLTKSQSTVAAGLVSIVQNDGVLNIENTTVSATLKAANIVGGLVASNAGTVKADQNTAYSGSIVCTGSNFSATIADGNPLSQAPNTLYRDNAAIMEMANYNWVIYYQSGAPERIKLAAEELAKTLSAILERNVTVAEEKNADQFVMYSAEAIPGYYDYKIQQFGNAYYLAGGSSVAVSSAANCLIEHIANGDFVNGEYNNHFDYSLFSPLASDPSSFVPYWEGSISVPSWMTDFEEKIAALFDPNGRPLLLSHGRAGYTYFENTVEDTISNIMLGADILEMDTYHTKDGVIVMSHNATIPTAAKNRLELSAKPGYPKSLLIKDWTFAQLKELDIEKTNADGTVSTYKMASLYEILLLARGRCFVMIDKKDSWITTEDVLELAIETDSAEVFLYSMFLSSDSGYTGSQTATNFMKPYLAEHPEAVNMKKWYDIYMKHYNAAGGVYPNRKWALTDGTSGTGKVPETTADYERVVNESGSHVIMWSNELNKSTLFISGNYQASKK